MIDKTSIRTLLVAAGLILPVVGVVQAATSETDVIEAGPVHDLAPVDMYLSIPGIPGESRDPGREGLIEILSFSWGISEGSTFHTAAAGGGNTKVDVTDLTMTKYADSSGPSLYGTCCDGTKYETVKIDIIKQGRPEPYIVYTLHDVRVSSYSISGGDGGDRLTESVTLSFTTLKYEYKEMKEDGSTETHSASKSWSSQKGKKA